MLEQEIVKKLKQKPLTVDQIYQEYPFVEIEAINSALARLQREKSYNCVFVDGYYQIKYQRLN